MTKTIHLTNEETELFFTTFFKDNEILDCNLNNITTEEEINQAKYCFFKDIESIEIFNVMCKRLHCEPIQIVKNNLKYIFEPQTDNFIPLKDKIVELKIQQEYLKLLINLYNM